MKKYYAILGMCGGLFVLCLAVLIFNPDSSKIITWEGKFGTDITTSPTGDALLVILGIVVLIAIIIGIVYKICKFITRIINRKNKKDFRTDEDSKDNKKGKGSGWYARI